MQMASKNEVSTKKPQSFSVALTEKLDSVQKALPKDFNQTLFVQNALAVVNSDPDIIKKYGQGQVLSCLTQGAYLNLNFMQKECYLVAYNGALQFQSSYTGMIKLCKKYSIRKVKDIYAKVVRDGDFFEEVISNGHPSINFKPKAFNKGEVLGVFAVCLFEDGGMSYDVMDMDEINKTKSASPSAKSSYSPWNRYFLEMAKKSCIKRLCKTIELEFESTEQTSAYRTDYEDIETDPQKVVENEIEEEANQTEFVVDADVIEVEEAEPEQMELTDEGLPF